MHYHQCRGRSGCSELVRCECGKEGPGECATHPGSCRACTEGQHATGAEADKVYG